METTKRIIIVLILVLFTAGPATSAETEPSNTTTASCLLKITSDPAILPLEEDIIEYLLHSSGVAGKAAREVLDTKYDNEFFDVEWLAYEPEMIGQNPYQEETQIPAENDDFPPMMGMDMGSSMMLGNQSSPPRFSHRPSTAITPEPSNNEQMILMRISVNLEDIDIAAAEEFMNALIDNLRSALSDAFDTYKSRFTRQVKIADEETARTQVKLNEMQERLRNISGSHILDRHRILDKIDDLRQEIQMIEMDKLSDDINVEAITNRIAKNQGKLKDKIENDAVTKEMKRIIALQEQQVEKAKKIAENRVDGEENLSAAEEKLSRARIELAQRLNELSKTSGGDLIDSLNRRLVDHSTKTALNQAKLLNLRQQLVEAEALLDKADGYEILWLKADIAKQNLKETILWRDRMSRQILMLQPPSVSVIGGN